MESEDQTRPDGIEVSSGPGNPTQPAERVLAVVREALNDEVSLDSRMRLAEELGIGSLTMVMIITELADAFGMDIFELADADLLTLQTVGDLVTFFTAQVSTDPAGDGARPILADSASVPLGSQE
jgi:acyl carrier protein